MAKSVTGLMFGFKLEDGLIGSLEDPVSRYVPEWADGDRSAITLRNVLEMASGLEHFPFNFRLAQNPYGKALRLFIGPNMEEALVQFDVTAPAGTEFNYNSANSQLLMLILQRVLDRPYAEYVSEKLWRPIGAKRATLWLDREGGLAKGYSFFRARPRDWLRLGLAMKDGGQVGDAQVIPAQWLTNMATPSSLNPKYGLHLWLGSPHVTPRLYNRNTPFGIPQAEPFLAEDVVFFDGGGGQRVYVVPSADLVIVRTGLPAFDWDDGAIPNRDLHFGPDRLTQLGVKLAIKKCDDVWDDGVGVFDVGVMPQTGIFLHQALRPSQPVRNDVGFQMHNRWVVHPPHHHRWAGDL